MLSLLSGKILRFVLIFAAMLVMSLAFQPSAEAGPLRRAGYRLTHPFAPLGSYGGPKWGDGTWRERGIPGVRRLRGRGC